MFKKKHSGSTNGQNYLQEKKASLVVTSFTLHNHQIWHFSSYPQCISVPQRAQALSLSSGLSRPTFSILHILPKILLFSFLACPGRIEPIECIAPYKTTLLLMIIILYLLSRILTIWGHFSLRWCAVCGSNGGSGECYWGSLSAQCEQPVKRNKHARKISNLPITVTGRQRMYMTGSTWLSLIRISNLLEWDVTCWWFDHLRRGYC